MGISSNPERFSRWIQSFGMDPTEVADSCERYVFHQASVYIDGKHGILGMLNRSGSMESKLSALSGSITDHLVNNHPEFASDIYDMGIKITVAYSHVPSEVSVNISVNNVSPELAMYFNDRETIESV